MKPSLNVPEKFIEWQLASYEEDHSPVHLADARFLVKKRGIEIGEAITRSVVRHDLPRARP
jgi:hypothetical protein